LKRDSFDDKRAMHDAREYKHINRLINEISDNI